MRRNYAMCYNAGTDSGWSCVSYQEIEMSYESIGMMCVRHLQASKADATAARRRARELAGSTHLTPEEKAYLIKAWWRNWAYDMRNIQRLRNCLRRIPSR